jgi:hypothetical protein
VSQVLIGRGSLAAVACEACFDAVQPGNRLLPLGHADASVEHRLTLGFVGAHRTAVRLLVECPQRYEKRRGRLAQPFLVKAFCVGGTPTDRSIQPVNFEATSIAKTL